MQATARRLEAYAARFATDGFAPWTAVLKTGGRVAGWGGLNRDPQAPEWGVDSFIHPFGAKASRPNWSKPL